MKLLKKLTIVVALATVLPAYADEYKDTLSILREKNIITQQEYEARLKAYEEKEENKKFAEQRIDKDVSDSVKFRQADFIMTIDNTHRLMVQIKPRIRIRT